MYHENPGCTLIHPASIAPFQPPKAKPSQTPTMQSSILMAILPFKKATHHSAPYPQSRRTRAQSRYTQKTRLYNTTSLASFIKLSLGQYGHLNLPPLLRRPRLSLATTWPQGIIIGGFASVVCSLLTGHTKIAWKMNDRGKAISTGSSFCVVHSVRFSFWIVASLRRVGRAIAPAVVAR